MLTLSVAFTSDNTVGKDEHRFLLPKALGVKDQVRLGSPHCIQNCGECKRKTLHYLSQEFLVIHG